MLAGNNKAHSFPPDFESGNGRHSGIAVCFIITNTTVGYQNWLMERIANPLFVGSSPTPTSKIGAVTQLVRVPGS